MRPFVIYHGNCADGFGAAWVLWKFFEGNADFYPGVYQRPPPDVTDRHVILVDFSYKRGILVEMADKARTVLVLDHHKTAREDLVSNGAEILAVEKERTGDQWVRFITKDWDRDQRGVFALFDMNRSGAGIAWDFFYPGKPRPKLIDHIEDRDLWRFALPKTREIQAALFSYPYVFETWDKLIWDFETWSVNSHLELEGTAIERKHHKDIAELLKVVTRPMKFRVPKRIEYEQQAGDMTYEVVVPVANLPYTMTSDAGHKLCRCDLFGHPDPIVEHPFAACYWDKPDGRQFSLRSQEGGADVGAIAALYGGGGHKNASGFLVPYDQLKEFES